MRILVALAVLAAALFFLRTPDTDPGAMIEKYANQDSQFVERDGLRVHYRDKGNPDGPPLVLVHGSGSSLHTWRPIVDLLGEDYRVISYTQPGHGLTGPHPDDDYTFAGMADALDLVAEELGLADFALAGNSMGGWVSWRYAIANPDRINALILLDASGAPEPPGFEAPPLPPGFRILASPVGRFISQYYAPRSIVKNSALQSVSVKSVMTEAAVDRYWELLRYPGNRRAAGLRSIADRQPEFGDRLGDIEAPTLILWGDEDTFVPVDFAASFETRIPNTETVIYEGIGHLPMEETPERTARDMLAFLQSNMTADTEGGAPDLADTPLADTP